MCVCRERGELSYLVSLMLVCLCYLFLLFLSITFIKFFTTSVGYILFYIEQILRFTSPSPYIFYTSLLVIILHFQFISAPNMPKWKGFLKGMVKINSSLIEGIMSSCIMGYFHKTSNCVKRPMKHKQKK